jgi:cyclophilin family peptidyl-prolyl cis-trans isomerase
MNFLLRLVLFLVLLCCGIVQEAAATQVVFRTSLGDFRANLFDNATPVTVANFLKYVVDGDFQNSLVYRSISNFVVQGGGFKSDFSPIPTDPPIINESGLPNIRGTLAMATASGNPNSATSHWFINLVNNSPLLDEQNGGFTVFGEIVAADMSVVDAIAALPRVNAGNPFTDLPILVPVKPGDTRNDLKTVIVSSIVRVPEPGTLVLAAMSTLTTLFCRGTRRPRSDTREK